MMKLYFKNFFRKIHLSYQEGLNFLVILDIIHIWMH